MRYFLFSSSLFFFFRWAVRANGVPPSRAVPVPPLSPWVDLCVSPAGCDAVTRSPSAFLPNSVPPVVFFPSPLFCASVSYIVQWADVSGRRSTCSFHRLLSPSFDGHFDPRPEKFFPPSGFPFLSPPQRPTPPGREGTSSLHSLFL